MIWAEAVKIYRKGTDNCTFSLEKNAYIRCYGQIPNMFGAHSFQVIIASRLGDVIICVDSICNTWKERPEISHMFRPYPLQVILSRFRHVRPSAGWDTTGYLTNWLTYIPLILFMIYCLEIFLQCSLYTYAHSVGNFTVKKNTFHNDLTKENWHFSRLCWKKS